jgi:hypothetical protein
MKQITNLKKAVAFLEACELATSKDEARAVINGLCIRWLQDEKIWHIFAVDGHVGVDTHMSDYILTKAYKELTGHEIVRDEAVESQTFWLNNTRRRKSQKKGWEIGDVAPRYENVKPQSFSNDVNTVPWHDALLIGIIVKIITKIEGKKAIIYNRPDKWDGLLGPAIWERENYDVLLMPARKA